MCTQAGRCRGGKEGRRDPPEGGGGGGGCLTVVNDVAQIVDISIPPLRQSLCMDSAHDEPIWMMINLIHDHYLVKNLAV